MAATRRVKVVLEAAIGQYERNMARASKSADEVGDSAQQAGRKVDAASQTSVAASQEAAAAHKKAGAAARARAADVEALGQALAVMGGVTVGALGLAAKAAMDWETAWAGVTKTTSGTPEQMAALEQELRDLATTLPLAHSEIAAVAEAAGQLGVAREDIAGFTKTMIDLGETTNLTAEEAATSISKMMNIMGTAPGEVQNLGAALVELGNNGASTEKDILEMAQRIAGTAAVVGASESDVLALANALSSLGLKAQAGGSSVSRVLQEMNTAVETGGAKLEKFAETAGMSAEQFAAAFREDPIAALDKFAKGLGRVQDQGGNVVGVLESLGITGTENTRVMLALASSGDVLAKSLKNGEQAWKDQIALLKEAAKRYATSESRIRVAWNKITDAAIDAGATVLPVVVDMVESVADLAEMFQSLPGPVQNALTAFGGLAGAASLTAGGFLLLAPRVQEARDALDSMGTAGKRTNRILGKVGKVAGVAAAGFIALNAAATLAGSGMDEIGSSSEFQMAMLELSKNAKMGTESINELMTATGSSLTSINGLGDALGTVNLGAFAKGLDWVGSVGGIFDREVGLAEEALSNFDSSLAKLAKGGNFELAANGFKKATKAGKEQGLTIEQVADSFPGYLEALRDAAFQQGVVLSDTELLNLAMGKLPPKMDRAGAAAADMAAQDRKLKQSLEEVGVSAEGTVQSLEKYLDLLFATGLATLSTRQAQRQYEAAVDSVGDSIDAIIKKHGSLAPVLNKTASGFNRDTAAGRKAEAAFDDVASSGLAMAQAMAESGASQTKIQGKLEGTYQDLIRAANAFGITGDDAKRLARTVLGIPEGVSISSWMDKTAQKTANRTKLAAFKIPKSVNIDTFMSDRSYRMSILTKAGINDIPNSDVVRSYMENDAFLEALRTKAAVEGIPFHKAVSSFMQSAARDEANNTTAAILGIPPGSSVSSFMEDDAKLEAWATRDAVNSIPESKSVFVNVQSNVGEVQQALNILQGDAGQPIKIPRSIARPGAAKGMRIPKLAGGGRLPTTGPGTDREDGILGVSSVDGTPTANVDAGEWVVNRGSSDKYGGVIAKINRDDPSVHHLAGYRNGGQVGRAQRVNQFYAAPAVSSPNINVTALVENPWTGEQVEALVRQVSVDATGDQLEEARDRMEYGGPYMTGSML